MYKNSYYRLMIATALAMASNTTNTMMFAPEWWHASEQKPGTLEFKTSSDISLKTRMDCAGYGFLIGCGQQYFCATQLVTKSMPLRGLMANFMQWPVSLLFAFCAHGYYKGVIDGLRTQDNYAIGVVFNQAHPQTCCDEFHERDLRRKEFIADYRKMRASKTALDPAVVAAHNTVVARCIANKSFIKGYGYATALGLPTAMMLLAHTHSTQK